MKIKYPLLFFFYLGSLSYLGLSPVLIYSSSDSVIRGNTLPITIRRATQQESNFIVETTTKLYSDKVVTAGICAQTEVDQLVQEEMSQIQKSQHFSVFFENTFCGFIWVSMLNEHCGYIEGIWIDPAFRGKGIALHILQSIEHLFTYNTIDCIKAYIFAHNLASAKLFKKAGFTIESDYWKDDRLIGSLMTKNL